MRQSKSQDVNSQRRQANHGARSHSQDQLPADKKEQGKSPHDKPAHDKSPHGKSSENDTQFVTLEHLAGPFHAPKEFFEHPVIRELLNSKTV